MDHIALATFNPRPIWGEISKLSLTLLQLCFLSDFTMTHRGVMGRIKGEEKNFAKGGIYLKSERGQGPSPKRKNER
jgi:hypothetical protein